MVRSKALWLWLRPADQLAGLGGHFGLRRAYRVGYPSYPLHVAGLLQCGDDPDCRPARDLLAHDSRGVALALGREGLADRKVALLVAQAPLVEIAEHDAPRLLSEVRCPR